MGLPECSGVGVASWTRRVRAVIGGFSGRRGYGVSALLLGAHGIRLPAGTGKETWARLGGSRRMADQLIPEPLVLTEGRSVIAPLAIDGLPAQVEALGERWRRKSEFHLTAIAFRALERLERARPGASGLIERLAPGRAVGPTAVTADLRRVRHPARPELRTLIVMVDSPGLDELYRDLSAAIGMRLSAPPAHVTLYSSDPDEGIGIVDQRELLERAPSLSPDERTAIRRTMRFDEVFGR
jgi:hypothetical protein